ncbi:GNAT family N-acetyltransferase [Enterocloster lavalensis]|uniref:GNAT family N-acetyltransferase n=1 Tax=Enterocloster lavalensis TaxID=460384 RepID=UPI0023F3D227|nr:GNAT family N-acetyltransferase [Enterocloster lavalensis]
MENYGEGKQVYIRKLSEKDYSVYREVNYSRSLFKMIFDDNLMQGIWKIANAEDILVCTIIEKTGKEICGFCQLDKIDTPTPYIGIDMRDGYMGKGYAQEAARLLIDYASKHYNVDYFIWKADKDNYTSRHIAEKLGGRIIAEKTALPQSVIDFGKANGTLTDEDITYVCVYRIEKSCIV